MSPPLPKEQSGVYRYRYRYRGGTLDPNSEGFKYTVSPKPKIIEA